MRKIVIPTKLDGIAAQMLQDAGCEVVQKAVESEELASFLAAHADATGLIVRSEKITAEILELLPDLKLIVRAGAGYNTIDVMCARRAGVDVMNTPGANANAVAEEVVAMVLAAMRHIIRGDASTRDGKWEKKVLMGRELSGKTVGVVGLGNIGQILLSRLSGFEIQALGFDPMISSQKAEDIGVELCSLEELFTRSDVVTLHAPANEHTRKMVNAELLGRMKDGAILVNCARAELIDEDALRLVKDDRQIIFCNDVYSADKAGPKSVADVADLMLPHLGASTVEANAEAARRAAEQTIDYFNRGIARFVVNQVVPAELDEAHQHLAFYLAKVAHAYLGEHPRRIEASFYGGLDAFGQYLVPPIVSGLTADFDPFFDHRDAEAYLAQQGIMLEVRQADDSKKYGTSITLDLLEGDGRNYTRVSVRGTVAEGRPMVSRIDGFEHLYFDPTGHSLLVTYDDRPGQLARISTLLGEDDINIIDVRSPQDGHGRAIAVFKVNQAISAELADRIREAVGAERVAHLSI